MVSDKRLYFIIGAAILAVVAVVLVAFLAFPSKERDRGATHGDRKSPDGKRTVSGTRPEKSAPPPSPSAMATPRDTTPVQLPPQLTDEERATALEKKLFECLEELWAIYPAVRDGTASPEERRREEDIGEDIGKILGKLRQLKTKRAVEAYRHFAYRNKDKETPATYSGFHYFDDFIGAGVNPYYLADWDAPGARDLLFELLHAFESDSLYYRGIIGALGEVKDEKERAKKELLGILSNYSDTNAGDVMRHRDALESLGKLDEKARMAAFDTYVKDGKHSEYKRCYLMDVIIIVHGEEKYFKTLLEVASDESIPDKVRACALENSRRILSMARIRGSENIKQLEKELEKVARPIYEAKSPPVLLKEAHRAMRTSGVNVGEYTGPPEDVELYVNSLVEDTNTADAGESIKKVRDWTAKGLREYTGQNFGYLEAKSDEERRAAAAKWKEWYEKNKDGIRWNQEKYKYEVTEPEEPPDTPGDNEN